MRPFDGSDGTLSGPPPQGGTPRQAIIYERFVIPVENAETIVSLIRSGSFEVESLVSPVSSNHDIASAPEHQQPPSDTKGSDARHRRAETLRVGRAAVRELARSGAKGSAERRRVFSRVADQFGHGQTELEILVKLYRQKVRQFRFASVLRWHATGLSSKQIAERLKVTPQQARRVLKDANEVHKRA
jgi:hypothetical protein